MPQAVPIRRPSPSSAHAATTAWPASLVGLALALTQAAVPAQAQGLSGLGGAFRPQALPSAAPPMPGLAPAPGDAASAPAQPGGVHVVVTGTPRPRAVIDGRIVHVGDKVLGMKVTRIDAGGVVLAGENGQMERLLLNPAVSRQTAAKDVAKGVAR